MKFFISFQDNLDLLVKQKMASITRALITAYDYEFNKETTNKPTRLAVVKRVST